MMVEERFRLAQELSLDGFAILGCRRHRGQIVDFIWDYINPAAGRLLRQKDLEGRSLLTTLPVKDKRGLLKDFKTVVEKGEPFEEEIPYQTSKLSGWFRLTAVKLGDGLALSLRDITERKLWEESLKQSEARFRVITQSNMVGLFFWDENGIILDANNAFLQTLGYCREEFFQQRLNWRDLTPAEFWETDEKAMLEMKKSGACRPFEKEFRHKEGYSVPVLLGAARLEAINYEGVAFVVDISERKEMEKQREIFLGHELKTPLAAIKGFAQLLLKRLEKTADQETIDYLTRIGNKVNNLTQLINDLTDFTRIRAAQLEFRREVFWFDDLVKEVVADCQSTTKSHQIILKGKTGKAVAVDRTKIGQVLTNLLSNAIKYSPQADRVNVSLSCDGKSLIVAVEDFGFGIPKEEQEKIFQPFFRSLGSKELVSGVGLGLYISHQIVQHYGGLIQVESKKGKGSTFSFLLPVKTKI